VSIGIVPQFLLSRLSIHRIQVMPIYRVMPYRKDSCQQQLLSIITC